MPELQGLKAQVAIEMHAFAQDSRQTTRAFVLKLVQITILHRSTICNTASGSRMMQYTSKFVVLVSPEISQKCFLNPTNSSHLNL